ncbi:hypothetical protein ATCC90586_005910 [Pythium insidiosum]|nr:hypothetical protein ATCC90586_005910 [Pythium insidiosum]
MSSSPPQAAHSWSTVPCENPSAAPCYRALHVCAIRKDSMYIFGGYDGSMRLNDFYEYNFTRKLWSVVLAIGSPPSPRDRHVGVVYKDSFYVFAGFDGSSRVNDFLEYNFLTQKWSTVVVNAGIPPTPRHSHAAVVYDQHTWTALAAEGPAPIPRDSHVSVIYSNSMFIFGGSSGTAMNDFYELNMETCQWQPVQSKGPLPGQRFCHVATIYDSSLIIFGGYDGSSRLNDFKQFRFGQDEFELDIPESTIIGDLRKLVNNETMSDITFIASVLHAADLHNAGVLRDQCLTFMLNNFDAVTKTLAFEEMGRTNVDLVFELLKRR